MDFMLEHFNIDLDGSHHCALDDCLNLIKIVSHMNGIIANRNHDINMYYTVKIRKNLNYFT